MINVSARSLSKSFNYQNSFSTISHIANSPFTGHIIISTILSSPINNHKITMEIIIKEVSQIDISSISTVTSIMNSNSPNSNIIDKILILITSNLYRQISDRNRINCTINSLYSTVRSDNC